MMHGEYAKMDKDDKARHAEYDCNTLVDAEEIKKDGPRMKAAVKYAKEKMKNLKAVHYEGMEDNPGHGKKDNPGGGY